MPQAKILIIKTGHSEILEDRSNSRKVSLGDVLRTTPILHIYDKDLVTWVTDADAIPLLANNKLIHKLLPYDFTTTLQLESEEFDVVINLEKIPGICALADKIKARRNRYGFTFNSQTGEAEAYDKAYEVLAVSSVPSSKRENKRIAQDLLFEMVGKRWKNEEYSLGYEPQSEVVYDVALNTQVGQKWPTKSWPTKNWDKLESLLISKGLTVTRQDKQNREVLTNLNYYMNWLHSAKTIITNDSLGLHLGIAMKKNVIGLFGPTPSSEVYFYNRGEAMLPITNCPHIPCFSGKCITEENCINNITPELVYNKAKKYNENPSR
jgi:heptosyltransferase-2